MQSAVADMQLAGTRFRPYCQVLVADRLVALGRPEDARAVIAVGFEGHARPDKRSRSPSYIASSETRGSPMETMAERETCYGQALGVARLQCSPAFEQSVALSLARMSSR